MTVSLSRNLAALAAGAAIILGLVLSNTEAALLAIAPAVLAPVIIIVLAVTSLAVATLGKSSQSLFQFLLLVLLGAFMTSILVLLVFSAR